LAGNASCLSGDGVVVVVFVVVVVGIAAVG
jgi:hypothetical protein